MALSVKMLIVCKNSKTKRRAPFTVSLNSKHTHTSSLIKELHWLPIRKTDSVQITYINIQNVSTIKPPHTYLTSLSPVSLVTTLDLHSIYYFTSLEHTNLSVIVHFPYVPPSYGIIYHTISSNVNP